MGTFAPAGLADDPSAAATTEGADATSTVAVGEGIEMLEEVTVAESFGTLLSVADEGSAPSGKAAGRKMGVGASSDGVDAVAKLGAAGLDVVAAEGSSARTGRSAMRQRANATSRRRICFLVYGTKIECLVRLLFTHAQDYWHGHPVRGRFWQLHAG